MYCSCGCNQNLKQHHSALRPYWSCTACGRNYMPNHRKTDAKHSSTGRNPEEIRVTHRRSDAKRKETVGRLDTPSEREANNPALGPGPAQGIDKID